MVALSAKKVGLAGDPGDQADNLADLLRSCRQHLDDDVGAPRVLDRLAGHGRRLPDSARDLANGGRQLLGRQRDGRPTLAVSAAEATCPACWLVCAAEPVIPRAVASSRLDAEARTPTICPTRPSNPCSMPSSRAARSSLARCAVV